MLPSLSVRSTPSTRSARSGSMPRRMIPMPAALVACFTITSAST